MVSTHVVESTPETVRSGYLDPAAKPVAVIASRDTAYRGRIMALWVYVYLGTSPVGSIITGAIISAAGYDPASRNCCHTGAG